MAREALTETLVGAAVLAAAGAFLAYALGVNGSAAGRDGYQVSARFGQVGGLAPGADVRVAGVKVGTVAHVALDQRTYLARASLALDSSVRLPQDSTARIATDGLMGGAHVDIEPGSAEATLVNGAEITNTQGAVDLFGLIGRAMRPAPGAAPPPESPPGV